MEGDQRHPLFSRGRLRGIGTSVAVFAVSDTMPKAGYQFSSLTTVFASLSQRRPLPRSEAGQVRYWQETGLRRVPILPKADPSRFPLLAMKGSPQTICSSSNERKTSD